MNVLDPQNKCPKCHSTDLKSWKELSSDEKMIADRLPASAAYPPNERKKHRICTRCWFEETDFGSTLA